MMPPMNIMLATNNRHKHREFSALFAPAKVRMPEDEQIQFSHEETGSTFHENALGKALTLHKLTGLPVLSDDSGLVVPALGDEPGIYSARYGGETLSTEARNAYLLSRMEGITDRRAFFVCSLVLLMDPYRYIAVQETVAGEIMHTLQGTGGFGYDPLFYLPRKGCSMAELSEVEKHSLSHRGRAARRLHSCMADLLTKEREDI